MRRGFYNTLAVVTTAGALVACSGAEAEPLTTPAPTTLTIETQPTSAPTTTAVGAVAVRVLDGGIYAECDPDITPYDQLEERFLEGAQDVPPLIGANGATQEQMLQLSGLACLLYRMSDPEHAVDEVAVTADVICYVQDDVCVFTQDSFALTGGQVLTLGA